MSASHPRHLWLAASLVVILSLATLTSLSHVLRVASPSSSYRLYVLHAPPQQDWNHDENWQLAPADREAASLTRVTLPPSWRARYSAAARNQAVTARGGDASIIAAANRAWLWLRQTQARDGSWGDENRLGLTALALLGGLGAGDMPGQNPPVTGETSSSERALAFLLQQFSAADSPLRQPASRMDHAFAQSLCAYALSECLSCVPPNAPISPPLRQACRALGELLLQRRQDSSPIGTSAVLQRWDLQALRALHPRASSLGLNSETLHDGISQLERQLLVIEQQAVIDLGPLGGHRSLDPTERNLARNPLFLSYFQAKVPQATPAQWQQWQLVLRHQLLPQQQSNGSWPDSGKLPWHTVPNLHSAHANTCLALLMLQSYYRYTEPNTSHTMDN